MNLATLIAQDGAQSGNAFLEILGSIPWYGWVAIVAIVAGAVQATVKSNNRHKERMAMIQQGLDPDRDAGE